MVIAEALPQHGHIKTPPPLLPNPNTTRPAPPAPFHYVCTTWNSGSTKFLLYPKGIPCDSPLLLF